MDGYELWLASENAEKFGTRCWRPAPRPSAAMRLEMYRIARGVPRYGVDLRERDLPQETGQQHALNFSKGCYIGQEIVERIRARGNVHRAFMGFEVQGEPPQPGTKFAPTTKMWARSPARRACPFPSGERTLALGYLRREVAAPGTVGPGWRTERYRANTSFQRVNGAYGRKREET